MRSFFQWSMLFNRNVQGMISQQGSVMNQINDLLQHDRKAQFMLFAKQLYTRIICQSHLSKLIIKCMMHQQLLIRETIALVIKVMILAYKLFPSCLFQHNPAQFNQSCYIIQLTMEIAVQNVRKSHKLLMTATLSQLNTSGVTHSNNFPRNDEPTTHNTSSNSCQRKRFKTIQKNGCVRFVQQKEIAAVRPIPDKSETDSNSQHHLRHKRSSTSIQFRSDAVTETMKVRLEGKIQEARNKLEAMKMGFQRCLQKKQEIVNNVKNAKIVTRRYSMVT